MMKCDIKLYAHGVPNGQDSWGVVSSDTNYINSFYGNYRNVPAQMIVEVGQFGTATNCYYTYIVGKTSDNLVGRTGGYFALTLRINYYYADIQNIFNLLNAAYNKFIVGRIVEVSGGVTKYLIPDFKNASDTLKVLEQEINKYLMQFSSDSDFVSLSGFKTNGQNGASKLNLLDCDAKVVENHVKSHILISVSPYHQSSREQQARQEVEKAKREKEDIREDDQRTISKLRQDWEKANTEITRLREVENEHRLLVQETESTKKELEDTKKQLGEKRAVLEKVRKYFHEHLSDLSKIAEILGTTSTPSCGHVNGDGLRQDDKNNGVSFMNMKKIVRILPFINFFVMIVNFFVMIALLCIVGFTLPKITRHKKQLEDKPLREIFSKGGIDVVGISANNSMEFNRDTSYNVSLQELNLNGVWESNDFDISNNSITPRHAGNCEISYVVNDEVVFTRTIKVVE